MSYKEHFRRFLEAAPGRLHFAAHSHHLWPDVTFEAQARCWLDAARLADRKWDLIFAEVYPGAQRRVARVVPGEKRDHPPRACFLTMLFSISHLLPFSSPYLRSSATDSTGREALRVTCRRIQDSVRAFGADPHPVQSRGVVTPVWPWYFPFLSR